MKNKKWLIVLFIALVLVVLIFLRYGGEWLVEEDDIEKIDDAVIVLLMGSVADRALGASDLYNQGKAEGIIMVQSYIPSYKELRDRGITITADTENSRKVLIETGVAEEDITIILGDAQSTKDEAEAIAHYLKDKTEVDTILLVTSKYHSQRSELILKKALADLDVDVYSAPTPYDTYQARGWYKDREDSQSVVYEYIKLAHYFLLEQFHQIDD